MTTPDTERPICRVVHEALRAWALAHGADAPPPWSRAPKWMKISTADSVRFVEENPDADASAQHDQWMAQRLSDGWKHGAVKSAEAKTHPMLVPYKNLPEFEKRKDDIVNALVRALGEPQPAPAQSAKAKPAKAKPAKAKSAKAASEKTKATKPKTKPKAKTDAKSKSTTKKSQKSKKP